MHSLGTGFVLEVTMFSPDKQASWLFEISSNHEIKNMKKTLFTRRMTEHVEVDLFKECLPISRSSVSTFS